jgi:hypothetical protein
VARWYTALGAHRSYKQPPALGNPAVGRVTLGQEAQHRVAWAVIDVCFSVVAEVLVTEDPRPLTDVGQRHVGGDALVLDRHDVRDGAVFCVARDLVGAQLPPEAHVPQQIERRLVFLPLCRRDQGVTRVMRMIRARPPSTT